jgi:hypothetical protein
MHIILIIPSALISPATLSSLGPLLLFLRLDLSNYIIVRNLLSLSVCQSCIDEYWFWQMMAAGRAVTGVARCRVSTWRPIYTNAPSSSLYQLHHYHNQSSFPHLTSSSVTPSPRHYHYQLYRCLSNTRGNNVVSTSTPTASTSPLSMNDNNDDPLTRSITPSEMKVTMNKSLFQSVQEKGHDAVIDYLRHTTTSDATPNDWITIFRVCILGRH